MGELIVFLIALFFTIFWMVVGWRAMRAHEKLADNVELIARRNYRREQQSNPLGED
jgi:hypothetical protein